MPGPKDRKTKQPVTVTYLIKDPPPVNKNLSHRELAAHYGPARPLPVAPPVENAKPE